LDISTTFVPGRTAGPRTAAPLTVDHLLDSCHLAHFQPAPAATFPPPPAPPSPPPPPPPTYTTALYTHISCPHTATPYTHTPACLLHVTYFWTRLCPDYGLCAYLPIHRYFLLHACLTCWLWDYYTTAHHTRGLPRDICACHTYTTIHPWAVRPALHLLATWITYTALLRLGYLCRFTCYGTAQRVSPTITNPTHTHVYPTTWFLVPWLVTLRYAFSTPSLPLQGSLRTPVPSPSPRTREPPPLPSHLPPRWVCTYGTTTLHDMPRGTARTRLRHDARCSRRHYTLLRFAMPLPCTRSFTRASYTTALLHAGSPPASPHYTPLLPTPIVAATISPTDAPYARTPYTTPLTFTTVALLVLGPSLYWTDNTCGCGFNAYNTVLVPFPYRRTPRAAGDRITSTRGFRVFAPGRCYNRAYSLFCRRTPRDNNTSPFSLLRAKRYATLRGLGSAYHCRATDSVRTDFLGLYAASGAPAFSRDTA